MKKNMNIIATIISIFVLSNSCEKVMEKWYTIKIQNNTDKVIFVSAGCDKYGLFSYPDTILTTTKPSLLSVSPNDYNNLRSSIIWEEIVKEQPEGKLSIYFFNSDTINSYDWAQIKDGNRVMKRIDLSVEELENMNWTITYP
jgi:hypothetical protein